MSQLDVSSHNARDSSIPLRATTSTLLKQSTLEQSCEKENESSLIIEPFPSQHSIGNQTRKVHSPRSDQTLSEEETNSIILEMKEMDEMFRTNKKKSKFAHLYQSNKKQGLNQSFATSEKFSSSSHNENLCASCCGTLRWSTVMILTAVFSIMILLFVAIISSIIVTSYDELERGNSKADMKRVVKSFYDEFVNSLEVCLTFDNEF